MGTLPSMAACCSTHYSSAFNIDILGTSGLARYGKVIYMVITYCLLVLGYTCVNIPYGTLCGAMTQDIDERAKINTSRSVAAMIAIGIINIITVPLIGKLGARVRRTDIYW